MAGMFPVTCLSILRGHSGAINSVCFDGSGRYAVSGGNDRTVRLWSPLRLHTAISMPQKERNESISGPSRLAVVGHSDDSSDSDDAMPGDSGDSSSSGARCDQPPDAPVLAPLRTFTGGHS